MPPILSKSKAKKAKPPPTTTTTTDQPSLHSFFRANPSPHPKLAPKLTTKSTLKQQPSTTTPPQPQPQPQLQPITFNQNAFVKTEVSGCGCANEAEAIDDDDLLPVPPPPKTHKRVLPPSFSQNYNSNDLSAGPRTPLQKKTRSINNFPFEHNEQVAFPQPHEHTQNTSANSISSNPREFSSVSYKVLPSQNNDSCPKPDASTSTRPSASNSASSSSNAYASTRRTPGVQLSREQEAVLQFVDHGESIFYTGSAGTGKSVLMREIIAMLRSKYSDEQVAITAPTGIAASNIGGVTLHAFAGVGLAAAVFTTLHLRFALRNEVDTCNRLHLSRLPGETHTFQATHHGDPLFFDKFKDCMAPETLDLKIGAQVMLIKNKFTVGLVNGSMGRVIGFEEATGCPVVDFFEGPRGFVVGVDDWKYEVNRSVKATREQVPLLLAYAL
ncbi:hypothetical protein HDU79_011423 [Rhizoclosmatium sp. JEL0117]|nr:hypothetical protein HDU79_011423 [Rhizoclosmatium sp. JEL0117]